MMMTWIIDKVFLYHDMGFGFGIFFLEFLLVISLHIHPPEMIERSTHAAALCVCV